MTTTSQPAQRGSEGANRPEEILSFYTKVIQKLQSFRRGAPTRKRVFDPLPQPAQQRLDASLNDAPIDTEKLIAKDASTLHEKEKTVLYLAYGSNLCNETFRGARGIRPLSQANVLVPSLRLTFDLPGVPYAEPCFANTARRSPDAMNNDSDVVQGHEYHKDRWHKGLVGVVYEVTLSDYAHIIATEGGGSAYHDILIDCYVLPKSDTVPTKPDSKPFKAHTLFAPFITEGDMTRSTDRITRPDPSYAQPSARYLQLITDGAVECELPVEYRDYLEDIRPYTITTKKQAIGKTIFLATWMPFLMMVFALARKLSDKKGRSPKWVAWLSSMIFKGMWLSYDGAFKRSFGDGERTMNDSDNDAKKHNNIVRYRDAEEEALLEEVVETFGALPAHEEKQRKRHVNIV